MTQAPTERQLELLAAVFVLTAERGGVSPGIEEISRRLGMRSRCGAQTGVDALVRKGALEREAHKRRTLTITDQGMSWLLRATAA